MSESQLPRGYPVATVHQHGAGDSGGFDRKVEAAETKATERWTKGAHEPGRPRRLGRSREKLPKAGDVKNDTAGLRAKGNLRVKRRDPWRWPTHC